MNDLSTPPHAAKPSRMASFVFALSDIAIVPVLMLTILHLITGDRLWPVAVVTNVLHWLLLPAWVIAPVMWWKKHRIRAGLATANLVVWLVLYGGLFLPRLNAATCDAGCVPLRVMIFNSAVVLTPEDTLVQTILDSEADIVGLLETDRARTDILAERLEETYPYVAGDGQGIDGVAVLSRYPIREEETFYLQTERLRHLRVLLDVEGEPLTVIIAHPPPPFLGRHGYAHLPTQHDEMQSLAQMTVEAQPALLIGDFNMNDQTDLYRIARRAGLRDSFREAGWGFGATFPARLTRTPRMLPLVRIDYIFFGDGFDVHRAWVGEHTGSDHRAVFADLVWVR